MNERAETILGLLVLLILSAGCWALVFSKRLRQRMASTARDWRNRKLDDEGRELYEGLTLAFGIVFGMIFTGVLILGLISIIFSI